MENKNLYSIEGIKNYRARNSDKYLLLDTNVFLLFLIGIYKKEYLKECSLMTDNKKCYTEEHFELLKNIFDIFVYRLAITPHILAEINMLTRSIKPPSFQEYFRKITQELEKCLEQHIELKVISANNAIIEFGFADISLIEAAKQNKYVILTDEFELQRVFSEHLPVIYFTNVIANKSVSQ